MESENHQEKNIICYICKICMEETELKNVYECPACHMIEEKEEKMRGKNPLILTTTNEVKLQLYSTQ